MSHDWPHDMVKHGDVNTLIKQKPHFEEQVLKLDIFILIDCRFEMKNWDVKNILNY